VINVPSSWRLAGYDRHIRPHEWAETTGTDVSTSLNWECLLSVHHRHLVGAATGSPSQISGLEAPALLERQPELARIEGALARSRVGAGELLVVEGPAGIGKTQLVGAAIALAGGRGTAVLSARGSELERDFAFGVVRQFLEPALVSATAARRRPLLKGVSGQAVSALELLPRVGELSGREGPSAILDPTTREGAAAVVHGLYWVIATLAERGPLLLCIDDAQWSDAPSWRFVAYLARRLEGLAVTVVLAIRTGEVGSSAPRFGELIAAPPVEVIALRALSGEACSEFVRRELGDAVPPVFCDACHAATAGSPFLLTELIAELRESGIAPTAASAAQVAALRPDRVARSVLASIVRLGGDAVELARAAAVLGDGARPRWARLLARLDPDAAAKAADVLVAANVCGYGQSLEFVHPLVRATVYDSIPAARRALAHAEAARLLRGEGADPDRVAAQLLLAEPGGDKDAVAALCDAAEHAERRGAPEVAVTYLKRSLDEPAPALLRPSITAALGRARIRAGDQDGLQNLTSARAAAQSPRDRAAIALELGRGMMLVDRSAEAVSLFAAAQAELADGDPALHTMLEAEEVGAALLDVSTAKRATSALARGPSDLSGDDLGERLLLAYGAYLDVARGAPAEGVAARTQRALAAGDLVGEQTAAAFCFATIVLCFADRTDEALRSLDAAIVQARERGSTLMFVLASWVRSHAHYRRGDVEAAEADAQCALDAGVEQWFTAPVGFLADALIERGELEAADAAFNAYGLSDAVFPNLLVANMVLDARGRLRCAQGRWREGLTDLLAVGERLSAWETTNPAASPWRSSAAVAHAALGELDAARRLSEEEVALARAFGAPRALGIALRAQGVVAGGKRGLSLLQDAVSVLESSAARLEYARALVDLGGALRRDNRRVQARAPLSEGARIAGRCGATALAQRAHQELLAAGARPRRFGLELRDALTPSERRVADLAVSGMSNREIAQALFITLRTVETHLTHAYSKLEITTRVQLAHALAAGTPARETMHAA
jgi:DNA-binding CsgD family transcriptional regulator